MEKEPCGAFILAGLWSGKQLVGFSMQQPIIGQMIKLELERQERSVSWFARKLSYDRSNIYRLFQKDNIDTLTLMRISRILQHNFFSDLADLYNDTGNE